MQYRYVDTVHSLKDCRLSLRTRRDQSETILRLNELLRASDQDLTRLEQQMSTMKAQVRSLQEDRNTIRQQRDQLASDKSLLSAEVSKLKVELGRSQEDIEEGLAATSDLIQQADYVGPLEGQLTQSQVENVNLRRQLAERTYCGIRPLGGGGSR